MMSIRQTKHLVASLFLMLGVMGCDTDYHSGTPDRNSYYMPESERSVWKNGTSANNKEIWRKRQQDARTYNYK